ncbi:MAG: LPS export ABC transporter periplasmic protein LptC, partial [Arcobacteraceae bacterium]
MRKILIFLLCIVYFLNAAQEGMQQEQFQVVAKNIDYENDIVTATGDVIMFSPTYYITAQKAVYNKAKNQVSLYDNVSIMKDNKSLSISNYSFIEFEVSSLSEVVFILYENSLWIESSKATSQ